MATAKKTAKIGPVAPKVTGKLAKVGLPRSPVHNMQGVPEWGYQATAVKVNGKTKITVTNIKTGKSAKAKGSVQNMRESLAAAIAKANGVPLEPKSKFKQRMRAQEAAAKPAKTRVPVKGGRGGRGMGGGSMGGGGGLMRDFNQ